jgi:hypothetical protein
MMSYRILSIFCDPQWHYDENDAGYRGEFKN